VLHQEILESIATDGIALLGQAMQVPACPRGGARARARAPADPRHKKLIQKLNIKNHAG
jgi:hypothetical protein